ncbi:uncharacterized protein LOC142777439 [Rhipicephalus microplus]|uniref:uncharacterized protein LOC142777439 n=1 Tax=Rhipicephalus microplus TaxID=6941 RepID=UPI003F6D9D09
MARLAHMVMLLHLHSVQRSTRSQSPLNAEPKDEPALQVKGKPGPQGAAVQVKEEPGVQEAASEEKQEGSAQGKEASAQQPATEMKVEAKELVNAESVMQLKKEGGVQQQQKKGDWTDRKNVQLQGHICSHL